MKVSEADDWRQASRWLRLSGRPRPHVALGNVCRRPSSRLRPLRTTGLLLRVQSPDDLAGGGNGGDISLRAVPRHHALPSHRGTTVATRRFRRTLHRLRRGARPSGSPGSPLSHRLRKAPLGGTRPFRYGAHHPGLWCDGRPRSGILKMGATIRHWPRPSVPGSLVVRLMGRISRDLANRGVFRRR